MTGKHKEAIGRKVTRGRVSRTGHTRCVSENTIRKLIMFIG